MIQRLGFRGPPPSFNLPAGPSPWVLCQDPTLPVPSPCAFSTCLPMFSTRGAPREPLKRDRSHTGALRGVRVSLILRGGLCRMKKGASARLPLL